MCVYLISTISYISNIAKVARGNCIRVNCQRGLVFPSTPRILDQGAGAAANAIPKRALDALWKRKGVRCSHVVLVCRMIYTVCHSSRLSTSSADMHPLRTSVATAASLKRLISTLSSQILPEFAVIGGFEKTILHRLCVYGKDVLKTFGISKDV